VICDAAQQEGLRRARKVHDHKRTEGALYLEAKRRHMSASDLLREFITEGLDRGLVKIEGRHRAPELLAYEQGRKGSGYKSRADNSESVQPRALVAPASMAASIACMRATSLPQAVYLIAQGLELDGEIGKLAAAWARAYEGP
jgi:hypothetical protein